MITKLEANLIALPGKSPLDESITPYYSWDTYIVGETKNNNGALLYKIEEFVGSNETFYMLYYDDGTCEKPYNIHKVYWLSDE